MVSILGANSVSGDYEVSNSLRFNDGDSASLNRTLSGSGTQGTYTFSAWIKRSVIGGQYMYLFSHIASGDGDAYGLAFHTSNNTLYVYAGSGVPETTEVFRDPAAWYHIVLSVNSTSYTLYVNGTSIKTGTAQSLVYGKAFNVGNYGLSSGSFYFDGYMTEVHFIDGTAKAATDFGETNDNGVWIPKKYTGTYGNNGFYLQFKQTGTSQNASGIGADTSGNGNHFAVSNLAATDITEDTCQNNFCTLNPLYKQGSPTFSEGNCKVVLSAGDGTQGAAGGIAPTNGKWYWEVKHVSSTQSSILVREASDREDYLSYYEGNYAGYEKLDGNQRVTGNTESTYGAAYANGDIVMVALDMDNDRVYFGKNGSWNDGSGNADEANLNDYVSLSGVVNGLAAVANGNGSATATFEMNFGNPSFSISSSNADANGYGNFEYSVPSGYYALCTKNLAEFG
jgi:hypothetical protein